MGKIEIRRRVREVLDLVDLRDKAKAFPSELSGGQQQRATIGRAIANHPKVLIADEPTGNLDSVSEKEIMELFTELNSQGKTIIIVSHEPEVAQYVRRILLFKDGEIIRDGDSR